jgi:hypothetical protein
MLFNQEDKIIFICVPKTASTAIKKHILTHSKRFVSNEIIYENNKIQVGTHICVKQIKNILKDSFFDYRIYFIYREPIDCIISKYKFYNYGRAKKRLLSFHNEVLTFNKIIRIVFALIMPFSLWSLVYPLNINIKYVTLKGKLPKNLYGYEFHEFQKNPAKLLNILDKDLQQNSINVVNKTNTNKKLILPKLFRLLLEKKIARETKFYYKLKSEQKI